MRHNLLKLLSDFSTLNGSGSLNRANDKLAEILHLIVDYLHPAPHAGITGTPKTGMEGLTTDLELLAKLAASIPVVAEVEQVVVKATATVEAVEALAKKGIDMVAEIETGVKQAAAEHGEPEPKVEVTITPAVITEAEVEPAIGLVADEAAETDTDTDNKAPKKATPSKKTR